MIVILFILLALVVFDLIMHAYLGAGLVALIGATCFILARRIEQRRASTKESDQ